MPYNLTTMQSIYHGQDEIELITYNNSPVYQKSGPVQNYDIRYTTTNNQKLTLADESDVAQHEFSSGVGYILLNTNTQVPYQFFSNCTTLADGALAYNFQPVAIFWVVASAISFILPVLNWKKSKENK